MSGHPDGRAAAPVEESRPEPAAGPGAGTAPATAPGGAGRTALLFGVASVLFGTAFVGIKAGLAVVPPALFAALRFDVAAVALVGVVLARSPYPLPRTRGDLAAVAAAGLFLVGINGVLLFVGQRSVTSAAAAAVYSLLPVLAPAFAAVLLGERLSAASFAGILIGLAGVLLIVRPTPAALAAGAGAVPIVGAVVSIAFGSVLLRRIDPPMPTLTTTAWAMPVGAALAHAVSAALGEAAVRPTPFVLAVVLYVGLPATAGAFPAYFALIRRIGPTRANLVSYVVPVVAAITGVLALGETVAVTTVAGFLVVAAGFAVIERRTVRAELARIRRAGRARNGKL